MLEKKLNAKNSSRRPNKKDSPKKKLSAKNKLRKPSKKDSLKNKQKKLSRKG